MSIPQSYSAELIDVNNTAAVRTFSGITSDGVMADELGNFIPFRYLSLGDQSRFEFPMDRFLVKFSPERALIAAAGQAKREQLQREQSGAASPKIN